MTILGSYADGRSLNYDEQTAKFDIGGTVVQPRSIIAYDLAGQLDWASEEAHEWFKSYHSASVPEMRPAVTRGPCPHCGAFKTTQASPLRWVGLGIAGVSVVPGFMVMMMMSTYSADRQAAYDNGFQFNSGLPWQYAGCAGLFLLIGLMVFALGFAAGPRRCAVCGYHY